MKKILIFVLSAVLLFTACGAPAQEETADMDVLIDEAYRSGYQEGFDKGYEEGHMDGLRENDAIGTATFSGCFTATVEKLTPDYNVMPGNTLALVHFFQSMPFLLHFQEDMTGQLIEGETYVFDFEPFTVNYPMDESLWIENYMYQIHVTSFRVAAENERGMESFVPDCTFG